MRKVVLQMMVSVDGYVAAPDRSQDWIFQGMDESVMSWVTESLRTTGTQLLGHVTYREQESYWPTADHPLADLINGVEKVVFSRRPESVAPLTWQNARLATRPVEEEIAALREEDGPDLYVPGGAGFVNHLSAHGLIDEYRLVIHPAVLAGGLPLFAAPTRLALAESHRFDNGVLANTYLPALVPATV